jgi:hypothetical protein
VLPLLPFFIEEWLLHVMWLLWWILWLYVCFICTCMSGNDYMFVLYEPVCLEKKIDSENSLVDVSVRLLLCEFICIWRHSFIRTPILCNYIDINSQLYDHGLITVCALRSALFTVQSVKLNILNFFPKSYGTRFKEFKLFCVVKAYPDPVFIIMIIRPP